MYQIRQFRQFLARQTKRTIVIGTGAIAVVLIIIGIFVYRNARAASVASTGRRGGAQQQVSVATVASLSPDNAPLSVIGDVVSENRATILAESAGEITNVEVKLGDHVSAGQIIATSENSSQQASL